MTNSVAQALRQLSFLCNKQAYVCCVESAVTMLLSASRYFTITVGLSCIRVSDSDTCVCGCGLTHAYKRRKESPRVVLQVLGPGLCLRTTSARTAREDDPYQSALRRVSAARFDAASDADSSMFVERPSDVTDHQSKPLSDSCSSRCSHAKHSTTSRQHRDFIEILRDRQTAVGTDRYLPLVCALRRNGTRRKARTGVERIVLNAGASQMRTKNIPHLPQAIRPQTSRSKRGPHHHVVSQLTY